MQKSFSALGSFMERVKRNQYFNQQCNTRAQWQFCTYDNTGDKPYGRRKQVDYYLFESSLSGTLVFLQHA